MSMRIEPQNAAGPEISQKRRNLAPLFITLFVICAVALVATWYGSQVFKNRLLKEEAIGDAVRWAEFVVSQSPEITTELERGKISKQTRETLNLASRAGGIFRYKLFDPSGTIVYASRPGDIGKLNTKPYFKELVRKGRTYAKIETDENFGQNRSVVSEAYAPIMENGQFQGAVEVYVDETTKAARFHRAALFVFQGVVVLLMGVAMSWTFLVWRDLIGRDQALSELHKRDAELTDQNERFNAALENMSQGLCMFDREQHLIVCNERYASMYDLPPEMVKQGTTLRQILEYLTANGFYAGTDPEAYIKENLDWAIQSRIQEICNGRTIAISRQSMSGGGWVATHEDITELRCIEDRLAHLAHHDALTDLPNRALLRDRMEEELKRTRRGDSFALLCLDLDGFKGVNDTLGHAAGDELLKTVAQRLRSCVRETDTVARLGGDEFAIIQTSKQQPHDATMLAKRICKAIGAPFKIGQNEVLVGTSIGISVAPKDGSCQEQLHKNADMALYRVKNELRGTYCFFEQAMATSIEDRRVLGLELRKALSNNELELHYQALFNLQDNKISGFEALLRWCHPEHGMVSPSDFIPIAEETGLIQELGRWVLHQACTEAATWPDEIKVAVNVSPVQFRGGQLIQEVTNALAASGISPCSLELEITESVLLQDQDATLAILHQLHDLGVRISMDDFGTGYSSLSYLQSFPFDKIKIDASFVKALSKEEDGIGIVQAVVGLATRLGVPTTAEGVETEEQLEIVRAEGCTEAQGYSISPPMPAKQIRHLFRQRPKSLESVA